MNFGDSAHYNIYIYVVSLFKIEFRWRPQNFYDLDLDKLVCKIPNKSSKYTKAR